LAHPSATDDGFREIQLNGKQLVFLFMAATVVSVVIFLCGVLVGRGVRPISNEPSPLAASESVIADAASAPPSPATQSAPTEPPPTLNELSYYDRLERNTPPAETLKPTAGTPQSPAVERGQTPPAAANAEPPQAASQKPAAASVGTSTEPTGSGYAVQVAALRAHGEADAIAKRLSTKGYPAYVMSPAAGAPAAVYRVRVGKFSSRREAEQVAARLEKEEQFKPWVIR
jgi:cell division septation protein DedD